MVDNTTSDIAELWLGDAQKTLKCGMSLARSLHTTPVTILLDGDLGAGKTTFMQGFAKGLGISDQISSPTYALEQRYETSIGVLSHSDLYRMKDTEVPQFIESLDENTAIRCIEWASKNPNEYDKPTISIILSDENTEGRKIRCEFNDIALPSDEQIEQWRDEVCLPDNIRKHCDAVADTAAIVVQHLQEDGLLVRPEAVRVAARLHDLLRFVDFKGNQKHLFPTTAKQEQHWKPLKKQYVGLRHEYACDEFMKSVGYVELGTIIRPHGCMVPPPDRTSIEQEVLYYADKRTKFDELVTVRERFDDFKARYTDGKETAESEAMYKEALEIEQKLFPNGPRF